jgi:ATP-binding cassette subfamily B protein
MLSVIRIFSQYIRVYLKLMGNARGQMILGLLGVFVVSFSQLIPAYVIGRLVSVLDGATTLTPAIYWGIGWAVIFFIAAVARLQLKARVTMIRARSSAELKVRLYHVLRSEESSNDSHTGSSAQTVAAAEHALDEFTYLLYNECFSVISALIGIVVFSFSTYPFFIVFVAIYMGLFVLIATYFGKRARAITRKLLHAREQGAKSLADSVGNRRTIQSFGAEEDFAGRVKDASEQIFEIERSNRTLVTRQWSCFNALVAVMVMVLLVTTIREVVHGALTISAFVILIGFWERLQLRFGDLLLTWDKLQQYGEALVRTQNLLASVDEGLDDTRPAFPKEWKKLSLQNVTFSYAENLVLKDVTLDFFSGERVGITGPSGAGKTTLVRLITGELQPQTGSVLIDGIPLTAYAALSLRRSAILVPQDCEVFAVSLKFNITLFSNVSSSAVQSALLASGLQKLVDRLPTGIDTLLGERGYTLSGGERQRLALARVLVRAPSIIALDESTAMLDGATERFVMDSVHAAFPQALLLVVSHHARSFAHSQRVIQVINGAVHS